jgi:hypothetical protein
VHQVISLLARAGKGAHGLRRHRCGQPGATLVQQQHAKLLERALDPAAVADRAR